ncbi:MAG TPA: hypothetical protein DEP35_09345 [Deltaproteobacteria bacterium]|nr:hypothetical protein [Deltaproteobacteria bacterium]
MWKGRRPASRLQIVLGVGIVVLILVSPFLLRPATERVGSRGAAALPLAGAVLALLFARSSRRQGPLGLSTPQLGGVALLAGLAVLSGQRIFVLLLPALVYAYLIWIFARSLQEPVSIIGRMARMVDPMAPDFIDPYCRKLTLVWCGVFAVNLALIGAFALTGRSDAWAWYAGVLSYLFMAAVQGVEFVVRKVWFRHYGRGPLDRLFARLFPSERTPQGRRSLAYIQKMRARIAGGED